MGVDLVIPIYTYESKYFYKEKKDRTFMKKPQLFKDLEGFFSNFSKDPFHESDPSEGRATRERVYLEKIIKGSKYKPEDIVGVALGVHHESGKPVQFWHVYLTERGITESKEGMFYEAYQRMLDKMLFKWGLFLNKVNVELLNILLRAIRQILLNYWILADLIINFAYLQFTPVMKGIPFPLWKKNMLEKELILKVKLPTASFCLLANPSADGVGHLREQEGRKQ